MWLPLTRPLLGTRPATQACVLARNRTGDLRTVRRYSNHCATPASFTVFYDDLLGTWAPPSTCWDTRSLPVISKPPKFLGLRVTVGSFLDPLSVSGWRGLQGAEVGVAPVPSHCKSMNGEARS